LRHGRLTPSLRAAAEQPDEMTLDINSEMTFLSHEGVFVYTLVQALSNVFGHHH